MSDFALFSPMSNIPILGSVWLASFSTDIRVPTYASRWQSPFPLVWSFSKQCLNRNICLFKKDELISSSFIFNFVLLKYYFSQWLTCACANQMWAFPDVSDPDNFDLDPDLDRTFTSMWIRILLYFYYLCAQIYVFFSLLGTVLYIVVITTSARCHSHDFRFKSSEFFCAKIASCDCLPSLIRKILIQIQPELQIWIFQKIMRIRILNTALSAVRADIRSSRFR
jgi:hypothetical protein